VAILRTPGYDPVARTDRASLTFGRTGDERSLVVKDGEPQCTVGDVNGDGHADLTCLFDNRKLGYTGTEGTTTAVLKGRTGDATPVVVRGEDTVRTTPV
jgi:hypothetical protein